MGSGGMDEQGPPILISRSADGWIVQVGVQDLRRFASAGEARAFADQARARTGGDDARTIDLTRTSGSDELLEDGQEEVFAREEVEEGVIEHNVVAGAETQPLTAP